MQWLHKIDEPLFRESIAQNLNLYDLMIVRSIAMNNATNVMRLI